MRLIYTSAKRRIRYTKGFHSISEYLIATVLLNLLTIDKKELARKFEPTLFMLILCLFLPMRDIPFRRFGILPIIGKHHQYQ